ncbi:SDR family NAD(P)-dependent oxidoreductase [Anaerobacillus sp. MEB173]|uniref:SDR family NAD(P)-dependent oxidoreductase n=1 Tax=Anaerobacillus sp. MEB173 TaxID=3383345 RepID=UPI003F8ED6D0
MKTILITGAGSGLGRELAMAYSQQGNKIILIGRTLSKLQEVKKESEHLGGQAETLSCNIAVEDEVNQTINSILTENEIDVVINNAGVGYFGPLQAYRANEIHEIIDTNIKGTIFVTKALLPFFLRNNKGKIMNIISTAGQKGKINESIYVASKFAVRGFTESLMKELEHTSINVTAVYMGGMATPFWEGSTHIKDPSRLKPPKDVAKLIVERDQFGEREIFI